MAKGIEPTQKNKKDDLLQDALRLLERAAVKIDPVYHVYGDIREFLWRAKLRGHR